MSQPLELNNVYDDGAWLYATSCYLLGAITAFRNGPRDEQMGCLETLARRVVGELGYAALIVVALVETVVRAILSIPCTLIMICLDPFCEALARRIGAFGLTGFAYAVPTILASLVALVQNVYTNEMEENTIIPCFKRSPNAVLAGFSCCLAIPFLPVIAAVEGAKYIGNKCGCIKQEEEAL